MKSPLELFILWFLSQDIVIYLTFVPLIGLSFFAGIISFARRE